jgi:hypothetical protein
LSTLFQNFLVPLASLAFLVWAYWSWSWMGLAMTVSAMVMWLLLHYTRLMHIFKQASSRPVGHVDSAVMFHVKLRTKMPLIKVIALTKSLGALEAASSTPTPSHGQASLGPGLLTPAQAKVQPLSGQLAQAVKEVFIWRDAQGSFVRCEFEGGRLKSWTLTRPQPELSASSGQDPQATSSD